MEIQYKSGIGILFLFPKCEFKVALGILKAIYNLSPLSFIKEAISDLEIELRPKLTIISHFHYCTKCAREIDDRVGDNFIHYTSRNKDDWKHKVCPPLKQNTPEQEYVMNISPMIRCYFCGVEIDIEKEYYRKIVDINRQTRYWHNDARNSLKDCWYRHISKVGENLSRQKRLFQREKTRGEISSLVKDLTKLYSITSLGTNLITLLL